jgi:hypothetical protein
MRANQLPLDDLGGLGIFTLMARALTLQPPVAEAFARPEASPLPKSALRRGLLDGINHWFWKREQRAVEAYLAKSRDVFDLEARIRHLERSTPHPYY